MPDLYTLLGQSNPKFEILPTAKGQHYWRFKAANGEILCHSENYASKQGAENGVMSLISNIKAHF